MEQLPKRIYDICDFEIARCYFVKQRREQEKVIVANEANLHRTLSCQQFLKMNGGINPAETTTENDNSLFAPVIGYRRDHRFLSVARRAVRTAISVGPAGYSGGNCSLFVSSSFACATSLGPD